MANFSSDKPLKTGLLADHPEAIGTVARWYHQMWGLQCGISLDESLKSVRIAANREGLPQGILLWEADVLVAAAELKLRENRNHPEYEYWLGGVYVDKDSRGRGLARALIEAATARAAGLGIETLHLQCEHALVPYYSTLGFEPLHEARHRHWVTTIMAKEIRVTP